MGPRHLLKELEVSFEHKLLSQAPLKKRVMFFSWVNLVYESRKNKVKNLFILFFLLEMAVIF
jgi:hypothetical protein